MARKTISVDLPLDAWYFYEIDCPICRYVLHYVMLPLQTEGYIRLRPLEISGNAGTEEVDGFDQYSEWGQESLTPTIFIIDRHMNDFQVRELPGQILHLWEIKGSVLTGSDVEKAEKLREQIIEAVQNYKRPVFEDFHDKKRHPKLMIPRRLRIYPNGSV